MGAVAEAPSAPETAAAPRAVRLFDAGGDTLEASILRAWDELVGSGRARCPVCTGPMSAAGGCTACGSELS